jgi:hypothetical protein
MLWIVHSFMICVLIERCTLLVDLWKLCLLEYVFTFQWNDRVNLQPITLLFIYVLSYHVHTIVYIHLGGLTLVMDKIVFMFSIIDLIYHNLHIWLVQWHPHMGYIYMECSLIMDKYNQNFDDSWMKVVLECNIRFHFWQIILFSFLNYCNIIHILKTHMHWCPCPKSTIWILIVTILFHNIFII